MALKTIWILAVLANCLRFISTGSMVENGIPLFEAFIKEYNKTYRNMEKIHRLKIFLENLENVKELNKRDSYATYGVNKFSDLSSEEFGKFSSATIPTGLENSRCTKVSKPRGHDAPDSLDWRLKGIISPVKAQGDCWSGWTFAASGVIESRYAMKYKKIVDLSEQQLLDCVYEELDCTIGNPASAFSSLVLLGGLNSEDDYPYRAMVSACSVDMHRFVANVTSCKIYEVTEDDLKQILYEEGPIAVTIKGRDLKNYKSGIFSACTPDWDRIHGALLIGYGTENEVPYWILKNSWGTDWGESGFFRLKRGDDACFIASYFQSSADIA